MHYTCITCITIDSALKIDKKIICKLIQKNANVEAKKCKCLDSKSDAELMTKLKSDFDNDSGYDTIH